MDLLIDLGNSRLKWAQYAPDVWRPDALILEKDKNIGSTIDSLWEKIAKPDKLVVCSVSGQERLNALEQWAHARWSVAAHIVQPQPEQLGVKNLYINPQQLGADRWAALIGARSMTTTAACVVDAGTAVTVDALSAKGEFLGGAIFPGLKLLRESLARGTAAITATPGNISDGPGRSTEDGVAAGTLLGLAGALEHLVDNYRPVLGGKMKIFLTGGDAPVLSAHLRFPTIPVPDLVLKGLARIADSL